MCACSPERQLFPWLHQNKGDQQVEGGDSPSLLCSSETLPGVLCSAPGPPAQEGHERVRMSPEEGHKDDQRAGEPLL